MSDALRPAASATRWTVSLMFAIPLSPVISPTGTASATGKRPRKTPAVPNDKVRTPRNSFADLFAFVVCQGGRAPPIDLCQGSKQFLMRQTAAAHDAADAGQ